MFYVATRNSKKILNFIDCVLQSAKLSTDGLLLPSFIKRIDHKELLQFNELSYQELFFKILEPFIDKFIDDKTLKKIIDLSFQSFDKDIITIDNIEKNRHILHLTHGPTQCIYDYSNLFITNVLNRLAKQNNLTLNIFDCSLPTVKNISLLYAMQKVSNLHGIFLTKKSISKYELALINRYQNNSKIIQVDSDESFLEDFMYQAANNSSFIESYNISFINEMNFLTIISYIPIFIYTYLKLGMKPFCVSIPTNSLTIAMAAYIAKQMDLPIKKIILATEKNDFLYNMNKNCKMSIGTKNDGNITTLTSKIPLNIERLLYYLYNANQGSVKRAISELYVNGKYNINPNILEEFKQHFCIALCNNEFDIRNSIYILARAGSCNLDPHFVVAKLATEKIMNELESEIQHIPCVIFNTVDPVYNIDLINNAIGYTLTGVKQEYNSKELNTNNFITTNNNPSDIFNAIVKNCQS